MMHAALQSSRTGAEPAPAARPALLQRKCACSESGEGCERCAASGSLARSSSDAAAPGGAPASVGQVLDSPGQGLDTGTRGAMEGRFGRDFSQVRIHADSAANASASAVHASAYTVGNHIAFAGGRYRPGDPDGDMLLAHELTHVVQQGGTSGPLQRSPDGAVTMQDDAADEDEADIAAEAVSFGWKVNVPARKSPAAVARAPLTYGDAAGGCGICYRGNVRQIGRDAHAQIQAEMEAIYPFLLTNFLIEPKKMPGFLALDPTKEKGLKKFMRKAKGVFKRLVPDLIMATPTGFALGEIKPFNSEGVIEGEAKLQLYEHFLNARYKGVNPGMTIERMKLPPPPPVPFVDPKSLTCLQMLGVLPAARGLYMYLCAPAFSNEVRKRCRCIGDPPKGEDKATKATNKGFGLSFGSTGASAYSAGIGVSIYSSGLGVGNAGVGVSIMSSAIGAGNASVGVTAKSSSESLGSVGAGATYDTTSVGAGTAGAGASSDSTSKAAGTAGAGTSSGTDATAAGVAGAGSIKDSDVSATGTAGTGKVEDASGKAGGKQPAPTGAESGDTAGKGSAGTAAGGAQTTDKGGTGTGSGSGAGTGTGTGTGTGSKPGDKSEGKPGDTPGAAGGTKAGGDAQGKGAGQPGAGTGTGTGTQRQGSDLLTAKEMAAFGLHGQPITHDQLNAALDQARLIRELIAKSSPEQQALLQAIAASSPDGQYKVPAAEWIQKMLTATQGISQDDIAYLKTLNWKPAKVSADELRKSILAALAKKPKTPAKATDADQGGGKVGDKAGDKTGDKTGGKGTGKGDSAEAGAAGSKDSAKAGVKVNEITSYRISTDKTNTARDYWFVNFENVAVAKVGVGDTLPMTLAFFGENKTIHTFKLKFTVKERTLSDETRKVGGKSVTRKAVMLKLEGTNSDRWDIAPSGGRPFILPKNAQASFKGYL